MTTTRRFPILPLLVGVLLGFIGGYFAGGGGRPAPTPAAAKAGAPAGEGGAGRIEELESAVARDRENPKLLTALGNALY
ncbi:MAG TPA: hypothetical protein VFW81_05045, partial [Thermoanaerobaculia bacterium]|nr:hypothetical protein [Thermoanaerobaculia bacterium]